MDKISSQIRSTAQAPGISCRARGAVKCRRTMFDVPSDIYRRMSRECTSVARLGKEAVSPWGAPSRVEALTESIIL
jgi:hypothetical protein